jgi:glycosyltransferase involved in cell wall biosynthesis
MKKKSKFNFGDSMPYLIARGIWYAIREIRKKILQRKAPENILITLYPEEPSRGRVLLSYITQGFFLKPGMLLLNTHTNIWESVNMAEAFVELGYEVDVIHWTNSKFLPKYDYSYFIDVRRNMERLAPILNGSCIKLMHLDTTHILFHNAAEAKRLLQLKDRRGITLPPRRFEMPNLGIEHADYGTLEGNDFALDTFKYANKKIFKVPSPCGTMFDWPEKDWDKCRNNFLWFSSGGFVHKGLDLALEAFSDMPDCYLTVCGPLNREKDFERAFYKELYETPNIKTIGWIDVNSHTFREITATCCAIVSLSCSEAGGTATKICMHAGLIPVVSLESGIDVNDFSFVLKDCSIKTIIDTIKEVSALPQDEMEEKARNAWEFARRYHTRENFAKEYRKVIMSIIEDGNK